jgi:hypothetical protein
LRLVFILLLFFGIFCFAVAALLSLMSSGRWDRGASPIPLSLAPLLACSCFPNDTDDLQKKRCFLVFVLNRIVFCWEWVGVWDVYVMEEWMDVFSVFGFVLFSPLAT